MDEVSERILPEKLQNGKIRIKIIIVNHHARKDCRNYRTREAKEPG